MALVRRETAISDGSLTRPLMNLHSRDPVLTVLNFHHGLLGPPWFRQLILVLMRYLRWREYSFMYSGMLFAISLSSEIG